MKTLRFKVEGMHCATCALATEKAIKKVPGVAESNVNFATERANVTLDETQAQPEHVMNAVKATGYTARLDEPVMDMEYHEMKETGVVDHLSHGAYVTSRGLISAGLLSIPLFLTMVYQPSIGTLFGMPGWDVLVAVITWYMVVRLGAGFHRGFWRALKQGRADMDTLVTVGTGAALLWSTYALFTGQAMYFESAGIVIFFLLLGKWLEARQRRQAGEAIQKLLALHAKQAHRIKYDGTIEDVDPKQLVVGNRCLVKSGERIPMDGKIIKGHSAVDESMLTGESMPKEKQIGDPVFAATINATGSFEMEVTVEPGKSLLDGIVATVEHALATKSRVEKLVDRVSAIFVPAVIAISVVTFIITAYIFDLPLAVAIQHAVAVLVVACPCAMGLATPAAVMVGTGAGAKQGILVKDGSALEAANNIDLVVFDKTGTLTQGKPTVTDLVAADETTENELLSVAAGLEAASEHPLAIAILSAAQERKVAPVAVENFQAVPGQGIQATQDGQSAWLGTQDYIQAQGIAIPAWLQTHADTLRLKAKTVIVVARGRKLLGAIAAQDRLKVEAKQALAALKKERIEAVMITGDHQETAKAVAEELGIARFFASVTPVQKAELVKKLQTEGHQVAFVGDGLNDAPALAQANLGLAIGTGTDVAVAAGGLVLMNGSPQKTADAIRLARLTFRAIRQNLFWAFAYNVVLIPLAAFGFVHPILAGLAMAFSSVSVLGNSLRIKGRMQGRSA